MPTANAVSSEGSDTPSSSYSCVQSSNGMLLKISHGAVGMWIFRARTLHGLRGEKGAKKAEKEHNQCTDVVCGFPSC